MLLRYRLGRMWLRRPVTLLFLASVLYQGVSQVFLSFPSVAAQAATRDGIAPASTDDAALLESAGMLALAIAYLLTSPQRAKQVGETDAVVLARALDWRLLAVACLPLGFLTYDGRGYNSGTALGAGTPLDTDLASAFFTMLVVLAALGLILRHGRGWFLPALVGQSVVLAAAGERTPVVVDAIALILMLARAGTRPTAGQLRAAAAVTMVLVLAIAGARAKDGRSLFSSDSGVAARATALGGGIASLGHASAGGQGDPGLAAQAATRLDGDAFAGAILQAEHLGQPRLSAAYVPESLLLTVPTALWSSKLSHGLALNPAQLETNDFGLQQINFLVPLPGLYAGFLPPSWLVIFLACLGALFGWAERWLLRSCTPARLVMLAGAVTAALQYEAGLPAMLVTLRTAAAIAVAVRLLEVTQARQPTECALASALQEQPEVQHRPGFFLPG